jgi:hypothetical protein
VCVSVSSGAIGWRNVSKTKVAQTTFTQRVTYVGLKSTHDLPYFLV